MMMDDNFLPYTYKWAFCSSFCFANPASLFLTIVFSKIHSSQLQNISYTCTCTYLSNNSLIISSLCHLIFSIWFTSVKSISLWGDAIFCKHETFSLAKRQYFWCMTSLLTNQWFYEVTLIDKTVSYCIYSGTHYRSSIIYI